MYYVYVLVSKTNKRKYIGSTQYLKQRIQEHNNKQGGVYTKKNAPFDLVFYEAFLAKKDALKQELFYKSGYGREVLRDKIKSSLESLRD